jgi:hypothetical protein
VAVAAVVGQRVGDCRSDSIWHNFSIHILQCVVNYVDAALLTILSVGASISEQYRRLTR